MRKAGLDGGAVLDARKMGRLRLAAVERKRRDISPVGESEHQPPAQCTITDILRSTYK